MKNQIIEKLEEIEVSEDTALIVKNSFMMFFEDASKIKEQAEGLVVTSIDQTDKMELAKESRLALKTIRCSVEKKRKELKDESLKKGKAIDGVANIIKKLISPIEDHLQRQENYIKIIEDERKAKLKTDREAELLKCEIDTSFYNLGEMTTEVYDNLLINAKKEYADKQEEIKRIEERVEAEKLEQERVRQENEQLRKQAVEQEKQIIAERKKIEREKQDIIIKAKAYKKKVDADKVEEIKTITEKLNKCPKCGHEF